MEKYKHYKKFGVGEKKVTKHHKKLIVFTTFLLIVFFLLFFAFSEKNGLTGIVIGDNGEYINVENLLQITADLQPFDEVLDIKGYIRKIEINTNDVNNFFYIGNGKFDLAKLTEVNMIISGYSGIISFDGDNIIKLEGMATETLIGDIPVTSQSNSDMSVRFNDSIEYNSLKLRGVYIESLSYTTSGTIRLNEDKILLDIDNEEVEIEEFIGDLKITRNFLGMGKPQFLLEGYVKKLNVVGDSDISIIQ